ncbi:MAG TPA: TerC family protein [Candidatus Acidoferrales bacterium]
MGTPALWIIFNAGVLLLLVLDLGVFNRRAHEVSIRQAALWSVFWVSVSIAFNLWILHAHGGEKALQFFTGYIIEQSMSVDNIFIFILVFRSFGVERRYQHRVLFWGIIGALVLRGTMIGLGAALIRKFEWALYVLAAFLVVAAIRMLFRKETEPHPERSRLLRWARKIFPVSQNYHGQKLWIREAGKRMATPLLLVLLVVEATDFVFALDSIPAVFGVSRDPFIVYSSNICAILGLRAFYFLLAGVLPAFRYLDEGLSVVLLFVGVKMLAAHWIEVPTAITLGIIAAILAISILASIIAMQMEKRKGAPAKQSNSGDK